jgi:mRNA-degrading endonuclease RelE of RelBE toxin-antitoxin system
MRYVVTWHPDAEKELGRLWLSSRDRGSTTRAANQIDRDLSIAADHLGEEFYGDRLYIVEPLEVTYSVSEADLRVVILQVSSR